MLLCERQNITDLLHVKYVEACERQNPELVERTIAAVSGEIGDMLSYRYPQPWPYIPELIRYCCAVISAYRIVEAITSLVDTEDGRDNEWLPLQKQWKEVLNLLEDIAKGRLKLPLEEANPDREEASVAVVSRKPFFDLRGL